MAQQATEKELKQANEVYEALIKMFEDMDYPYDIIDSGNDNEKVLHIRSAGDDLPMEFYIIIDAYFQQFKVKSPQPVTFSEDQYSDAAQVICAINDVLRFGCFTLDLSDGTVMFNFYHLFMDSLVSPDLWGFLIRMSVEIVDEYNDKLLMLAKGMIDKDSLLEKLGLAGDDGE
ncbi:MAG: YbjN domain-containing protein [Lachnospiraceae bacterium]|nr:YbjN domain-containing protein [Lachnospiraceae bacterium]